MPGSPTSASPNWRNYCFTYVRGLTAEQLVARLGGRPEDFTPMMLEELSETRHSNSYDTAFIGAATIGNWVFMVEPNGGLGADEEIITSLSAGTRLVSHFRDVEGAECFYWSEDGEIRFCFIADEGYSEEAPDEVVETMQRIDADYRHLYPSDGPAFLLAERLTGITLTPELLEGSTYPRRRRSRLVRRSLPCAGLVVEGTPMRR